jgi:DNA-binding CsgD family transcriptional regulator
MHKLTPREKECLYWVAQGKSSEETALILNIKTPTVDTYRKQIKEKLNCITIAQAVYKAMKQKQIS